LWLLSRTPTVAPAVRQRFIEMAKARGFDTEALIFVGQK
jgi:apolipoprotein D and lipocalin family protein